MCRRTFQMKGHLFTPRWWGLSPASCQLFHCSLLPKTTFSFAPPEGGIARRVVRREIEPHVLLWHNSLVRGDSPLSPGQDAGWIQLSYLKTYMIPMANRNSSLFLLSVFPLQAVPKPTENQFTELWQQLTGKPLTIVFNPDKQTSLAIQLLLLGKEWRILEN